MLPAANPRTPSSSCLWNWNMRSYQRWRFRKWWWGCGPEDLLFQISGNDDDDSVVLRIYCFKYQEMMMMTVWSWGFTFSNIRKLWWWCGPEDLPFHISGSNDDGVVPRIYSFKYQERMIKVWSWGFTVTGARVAGWSLQHGHHSKPATPNLQHTTNWEQDDGCGNSTTQSQAPDDGYINVRNMLST